MGQIIEVNKIDNLKLCEDKVIVGGCFDVFHLGHAIFLEKAKALGKTLIVLLESDEKVRDLKGKNRPINNQKNRAELLIRLSAVDFVINLKKEKDDYGEILRKINPKIIAITKGDKNLDKKKLIADKVGVEIIEIEEVVPDFSSSKIIEKISK